jgi:energy-coupling factor transporter ATP-binding protein EcfA2
MNPYLLPGTANRPHAPLCPFETTEHEKYYVPVDNTQVAFERFREEIGDAESLRQEGRLVVATGQQGCGKTSLINRCATWLAEALPHGEIISLVDESSASDPIEHRLTLVYECLLADLAERRVLTTEQLQELAERRDNLELGYRTLSSRLDALESDLVLIVVLPPSEDLVREIEHYARFARRKILFFAESSYVDYVDRHWAQIRRACRAEPVLLKVGPLEDGDGWLFAQSRQELHPDAGVYPKVSEETMLRVTTRGYPTSIGQLQTLLHGVYEDLRRRSPEDLALRSPELSYEEITDYFFRLMRTPGEDTTR